jgi:hypothetical protein
MTARQMSRIGLMWAVLGFLLAVASTWSDFDVVLIAACVVCSAVWGAAAQIVGRLL